MIFWAPYAPLSGWFRKVISAAYRMEGDFDLLGSFDPFVLQ